MAQFIKMAFSSLYGFSTTYEVKDNSFYKYYHDIDEQHWKRIKNSAILLSNYDLGPQIKKIVENENEKCHSIEYQIIIPFDAENKYLRPDLTIQQIHEKISNLVNQLHSLGYAHGDLHIYNIGFLGKKLYLLDPDSIFKIDEGQVEWISLWMKNGFEWTGSFEDFVEHDYHNWKSDWLNPLEI